MYFLLQKLAIHTTNVIAEPFSIHDIGHARFFCRGQSADSGNMGGVNVGGFQLVELANVYRNNK